MKKTFGTIFCASLLVASNLFADISAQLESYLKIDCAIAPRGSMVKPHPQLTTAEETSLNWSGYISTPLSAEKQVTSVSATWTVPALKVKDSFPSYVSIWVGMDGSTNEMVERVGTQHSMIDGIQKNIAWFDMYPMPSYQIHEFPLAAGDMVQGEIEYEGENAFKIILVNHTQNMYTEVPVRYAKTKQAKRGSAECIVEALYSSTVEPLAEFEKIAFANCAIKMGETEGGMEHAEWQTKPVSMISPSGMTKTKVSHLSSHADSFLIEWIHE